VTLLDAAVNVGGVELAVKEAVIRGENLNAVLAVATLSVDPLLRLHVTTGADDCGFGASDGAIGGGARHGERGDRGNNCDNRDQDESNDNGELDDVSTEDDGVATSFELITADVAEVLRAVGADVGSGGSRVANEHLVSPGSLRAALPPSCIEYDVLREWMQVLWGSFWKIFLTT
jgi:hypothetical protein